MGKKGFVSVITICRNLINQQYERMKSRNETKTSKTTSSVRKVVLQHFKERQTTINGNIKKR